MDIASMLIHFVGLECVRKDCVWCLNKGRICGCLIFDREAGVGVR
jgi:hypothetical protein